MYAKTNMFSILSRDSDDEEYERQIYFEMDKKLKLKKSLARERRDLEVKKQNDLNYINGMKKHKVIKSYNGISYVSEIEEDGFNIARYLGLDGYLRHVVFTAPIYGFLGKDEYLKLVKIMELNKNMRYLFYQENILEDIRYVQSKMETCVMSGVPHTIRLIYEIFLTFLQDTVCVRGLFEIQPMFRHMKDVFREEIKEKIENPYGSISEFENEYYTKYFEIGKRYLVKRNNCKVLFKKYLRFVGKIMVLYRKFKK